MEMKITLNGVERTITNHQLYALAKRGMIGPDTLVYVDGKPFPAGQAKGIVFGQPRSSVSMNSRPQQSSTGIVGERACSFEHHTTVEQHQISSCNATTETKSNSRALLVWSSSILGILVLCGISISLTKTNKSPERKNEKLLSLVVEEKKILDSPPFENERLPDVQNELDESDRVAERKRAEILGRLWGNSFTTLSDIITEGDKETLSFIAPANKKGRQRGSLA